LALSAQNTLRRSPLEASRVCVVLQYAYVTKSLFICCYLQVFSLRLVKKRLVLVRRQRLTWRCFSLRLLKKKTFVLVGGHWKSLCGQGRTDWPKLSASSSTEDCGSLAHTWPVRKKELTLRATVCVRAEQTGTSCLRAAAQYCMRFALID